MPTDDERREAARRLREIRPCKSGHIEWWGIAQALGLKEPAGWFGWEKFEPESVQRLADLIEPQPITGDTSDGYHTFNELYDHRAKLFSVIVRCFKNRAWKSKLHHDGTMYEGMFIVGIETSQGQAAYHYDIDLCWSVFDCKELARAPEWDGHTPEQAISRIASLRPSCDRDALLRLARYMDKDVAETEAHFSNVISTKSVSDYARRIREACGEVGR